jgi:Ca2+-transporting ATPase
LILTSAVVAFGAVLQDISAPLRQEGYIGPDIESQRMGGLRMLPQMLSQQRVSAERMGLSEREAAARLHREGYNELPALRRRGLLAAAVEVVREPMFVLLIGGGLVYLVLGELPEALALLVSVFLIIGITLYQEHRTERALEALRDLSSPRALVIRDGQQRRIAGREVVRGDVLLLSEGDRVPADALVRWAINLTVDESLLTGESISVRKLAVTEDTADLANAATASDKPTMGRPGGDDQPFVYSGTLVVQGRGMAEVLATGPRSEMGKIGRSLQEVQVERTPLQRETGRLVRVLAVWGLFLCAVLVVGYGLLRGQWLEGVLAGIALAMSVLPEEFPVVLTVFLALGAWRIAQKRVLTRRVPAVETLGAATVLCVDKTGTLTQNRMSVRRLFVGEHGYDLGKHANPKTPTVPPTDWVASPEVRDLARYALLASQTDPFDPMEKAIVDFAQALPVAPGRARDERALIREYPLTPGLLAVTRVWRSSEDPEGAAGNNGADSAKGYIVAAKGAPEAIAHLCRLDAAEHAKFMEHVAVMVEDGLRVLGVARARQLSPVLPESPEGFALEVVGLLGFADPIRPEVPTALQECYSAGIRVIMITGDYPGTAQSIARQIGLQSPEQVITGSELEAMDVATLRSRLETVNIFARVVPAQKLRLVEALKARGEVVAMTGDGVNDAPALKAAHIGIAMGGRGTDVAREAAALVLLDDDFSSIVGAVRMGRRIFDNLRKAMSYVLAIHVPIAGMALLPVLFGWPLVLLPVQIVFLELIIDPASSIVFEAEPEEADVMQRPPRDPRIPLFTRAIVGLSLAQGASIFAIVFAVFRVSLTLGAADTEARALAFSTLVVANLALVLAERSRTRTILASWHIPNAAVWWVVGGALSLLAAALYIPGVRDLFGFAVLHPSDLLICLAAGMASILWFEVIKTLGKRRRRDRPGA